MEGISVKFVDKMGAGGLVQVARLNKQIVADSQVNSEERGMV